MKKQPEINLSCLTPTFAIAATMLFTVLALALTSSRLRDQYRVKMKMPDIEVKQDAWFGPSNILKKPADVSYSMLPDSDKNLLILLLVFYPLAHILLAKLVCELLKLMTQCAELLYGAEKDPVLWTQGFKIFVGSIWPITVLLVPVLLLMILFGFVFKENRNVK